MEPSLARFLISPCQTFPPRGVIHPPEKLRGMVARVEDAVILADQFGSGVLTDGAKLVVHVGNRALNISDGDDRMLIEGKLLIGQLLQRNRAGAEAFSSIGLQHSHFGHRHFRKNSSSLGTLKDSNGGSMWLGAGGRSSQVPHTQSRGSPPVYSSATGQSNFSRAAAVLRPHNRLWTLGLIPRPGRPCWLSPLSI